MGPAAIQGGQGEAVWVSITYAVIGKESFRVESASETEKDRKIDRRKAYMFI